MSTMAHQAPRLGSRSGPNRGLMTLALLFLFLALANILVGVLSYVVGLLITIPLSLLVIAFVARRRFFRSVKKSDDIRNP